jgi:hypothetical protein
MYGKTPERFQIVSKRDGSAKCTVQHLLASLLQVNWTKS